MLEDLGPSFVKIGQTLSTRSEILPKAYCDELKKLRWSATLPFDQMLAALDDIYGERQATSSMPSIAARQRVAAQVGASRTAISWR